MTEFISQRLKQVVFITVLFLIGLQWETVVTEFIANALKRVIFATMPESTVKHNNRLVGKLFESSRDVVV